MTRDDCKKLIVQLAIKHGVPPKLIAERLLSLEDKEDMVADLISSKTLDCFVKVWKEYGMCHYANGTGAWYGDFKRYAGVRWGLPEKTSQIEDLAPIN